MGSIKPNNMRSRELLLFTLEVWTSFLQFQDSSKTGSEESELERVRARAGQKLSRDET